MLCPSAHTSTNVCYIQVIPFTEDSHIEVIPFTEDSHIQSIPFTEDSHIYVIPFTEDNLQHLLISNSVLRRVVDDYSLQKPLSDELQPATQKQLPLYIPLIVIHVTCQPIKLNSQNSSEFTGRLFFNSIYELIFDHSHYKSGLGITVIKKTLLYFTIL